MGAGGRVTVFCQGTLRGRPALPNSRALLLLASINFGLGASTIGLLGLT
ncbi:MAG: hypothetical protein ACJAXU_002219 [Paracoccaceae bacterium]